jgi:hypothetical protein
MRLECDPARLLEWTAWDIAMHHGTNYGFVAADLKQAVGGNGIAMKKYGIEVTKADIEAELPTVPESFGDEGRRIMATLNVVHRQVEALKEIKT